MQESQLLINHYEPGGCFSVSIHENLPSLTRVSEVTERLALLLL